MGIMITIPILVGLAGLIIFLAAKTNAKVSRIGEIMFAVGLFFSVWLFSGKTI